MNGFVVLKKAEFEFKVTKPLTRHSLTSTYDQIMEMLLILVRDGLGSTVTELIKQVGIQMVLVIEF